MVSKINNSFKKLYILFFAIFLIVIYTIANTSYALENNIKSTIVINENYASGTESIFRSDGINNEMMWYPGFSTSGILRIKNEFYKKVNIDRLGISVSLSRNGKELSLENIDALDYLGNMIIKVEYTNIFKKVFKGIVYEGTFKNFLSGVESSISIKKNEYIDLKYTITMDVKADNNTENIKGDIDFTINVKGIESNTTNNNTNISNDENSNIANNNTITVNNDINKYKILEEINYLSEYTDINENHWAFSCINELVKRGIIIGYPDKTIRPNDYITRAEVAVLISKALGLEVLDNITINDYNDYLPKWSKKFIVTTTLNGIFVGYPDRTFRPKNYTTREEMTAVFVRAFKLKNNSQIELHFKDKKEIGFWAINSIKTAVSENVIYGYTDNTFKPKRKITRAETFSILYNLLKINEL